MQQFFITADQVAEGQIFVEGPDVNHIKNVLRMREGELAYFVAGDNLRYTAAYAGMRGEAAVFSVTAKETSTTELPVRITLFQGIPKGDKLEWITEKCVELGVYRIVPVAMRRSVRKIEKKKEAQVIRHLNGIAESAAKQAKRAVIPEVTGVMDLASALHFAKEEGMRLLLPYELERGIEKTRELLGSLKKGEALGIFIGPEGGFDKEEADRISESGGERLTLGKRILRTETAGMALLSVLAYLLEE